MQHCPRCLKPFTSTEQECPDCLVELVHGPPPDDEDLAVAFRTEDYFMADRIAVALNGAGIRAMVHDQRDVFGMVADELGQPFEVCVMSHDLERAAEIARDFASAPPEDPPDDGTEPEGEPAPLT